VQGRPRTNKEGTWAMTLKRAKERARIAFNRYICKRDGYICYTCEKVGTKGEMDAGHFIPATRETVRFNEINVHCQCTRCNRFMHGNAHEYAWKIQKEYGPRMLDELHEMAGKLKHWTVDELLEIEKMYIEKFKETR
jgi:5-methylcytosine-specific restriction endonuclease McrA